MGAQACQVFDPRIAVQRDPRKIRTGPDPDSGARRRRKALSRDSRRNPTMGHLRRCGNWKWGSSLAV